ncbi:MAG: DUF58 domain-containing protein [Anaerolineae bacterium]|nr:DUF58 domain-containing protein [Anaerolineae bacterium]
MLSSQLIQQIRRIEIRTRKLVNNSFAGEYHSVFKGRGMEFDEARPYQPGDEIRSIDWNVTARTGVPYIKEYVESRELTLMIMVDMSASADFGSVNRFKRELAAELAGVLAFAATNNNDKVGLMLFTDKVELFIPPRKGRKHVLRIIRDVLAFEPHHSGTDINLALETLNRLLKRRAVVFVISDFLDNPENYRTALSIANRKHDVIAVDLNDPLENGLGNVGIVALEDPESGHVVWADSSNAAWRNGFATRMATFQRAKYDSFVRAGVDRIHITTADDYMQPLNAFFEQRARRLRH